MLTPSATRALLADLGIRPRRELGQNFLIDGNIVRKSLQLGEVQAGDRIVEIGPGLGTLTGALIAAGAEVYAIEQDRVLAEHLRKSLGEESGVRFRLTEGDAVKDPLAGMPAAGPAPAEFKIVANLPYAIASPWMESVLTGPLPERMVLMLQQEAASRYAASVGTKSFGAISVFLQAAFDRLPSHRVNRSCFYPQPDVGSVLAVYKRRSVPHQFSGPARGAIRGFFQHRRKQLNPMLRRACPAIADEWIAILSREGIVDTARPESIPVSLWLAFDELMRSEETG